MNKVTSVVLFLVPAHKTVSGGILSIFSICNESRKLNKDKSVAYHIITYPGSPTYTRNDLFDNNEIIYSFEQIINKYKNIKHVLFHVPEYVVGKFYQDIKKFPDFIKNTNKISINILNQNIEYMPKNDEITNLFEISSDISQTTAHDRYSTQETANLYGVPLKHLSVFIDPKSYNNKLFSEKERLVAYSSDDSDEKQSVLDIFRTSLPDFRFIEIKNMTYGEYKDTISKAMFVITFGEGFDGYLIEGVFSGAVPFSVYKKEFFPNENFLDHLTIYKDYKEMKSNISKHLKMLGDEREYKKHHDKLFGKLSKLYNRDRYLRKINEFYLGSMDFYPDYAAMSNHTHTYAKKVSAKIDDLENSLSQLRSQLTLMGQSLDHTTTVNNKLTNELGDIRKSLSWRITKPLRVIKSRLRKTFRA